MFVFIIAFAIWSISIVFFLFLLTLFFSFCFSVSVACAVKQLKEVSWHYFFIFLRQISHQNCISWTHRETSFDESSLVIAFSFSLLAVSVLQSSPHETRIHKGKVALFLRCSFRSFVLCFFFFLGKEKKGLPNSFLRSRRSHAYSAVHLFFFKVTTVPFRPVTYILWKVKEF